MTLEDVFAAYKWNLTVEVYSSGGWKDKGWHKATIADIRITPERDLRIRVQMQPETWIGTEFTTLPHIAEYLRKKEPV